MAAVIRAKVVMKKQYSLIFLFLLGSFNLIAQATTRVLDSSQQVKKDSVQSLSLQHYLSTVNIDKDLKKYIEMTFDSVGFVRQHYDGKRQSVIWYLDTVGFDTVFLSLIYIKALEDKESCVSGYAAKKLYRMNHPYAVEACFRTMNDGCDILHGYYSSPAALLSKIGEPVLPRLIDSLLSENKYTRFSAAHAVGDAMAVMYGLDLGAENHDDFMKWKGRWKNIGYDEDGVDIKQRQEAVLKLKQWFKEMQVSKTNK
ncbi:MAG: hypothetical protein HRT73_14905 [Flavobacteriales bacterium]|nr:hypothetical protein [Flavobacteriales bacterium]